MLHNVLVRQLPLPAPNASAARSPRPAIDPDRRPQTLGVGEWLRLAGGARADRRRTCGGRSARGPRGRAMTDPARRLAPGRPARAGEAQPDPRGRRAARGRVPRPPLGGRPAGPRRPAEPGGPAGAAADSLHVDGLDAGPAGDNLVLRAIAATRRRRRHRTPASRRPILPLAARLEKRIPVAAGLGGGSSDAAAAIDGALEAWGVELSGEERDASRRASARTCRSSSPAGPALIEGRGERVAPLTALAGPLPGVLLVTPAVAVATGDVFASSPGSPRGQRLHAGCRPQHLAEELARRPRGPSLVARAGVLAIANDLAAPRPRWSRRRSSPSAAPCCAPCSGPSGSPAPARRSGRSILRSTRRRPRRSRSAPHARTGSLDRPRRSPRPRSWPRRSRQPRPRPNGGTHDPPRRLDRRRSRRDRAVQPGDRRRTASSSAPASSGSIRRPASSRSGVEAQAERALRNLAAVLDAAGLAFADVVKTTSSSRTSAISRPSTPSTRSTCPIRRRRARRSRWVPCPRAASSRSRRSPIAGSPTRWAAEGLTPPGATPTMPRHH